MSKKLYVTLLFGAALFFMAGNVQIAGVVQAQEPRPTPTNMPQAQETGGPDGSIRGTLYKDLNGDGRCGPGDPILAWIPIRFVSDDGETTIYLQSGENGTYGLVAAGYGTWKVSADPPAPWVVTSEKTLNVFLGVDQKLALNVDFCLADVETVQRRTFLPQAGAPWLSLLATTAMVAGLGLLAAGFGLAWRDKRNNS